MDVVKVVNISKTTVIKPKKQTYDKMYKYSKLINDTESAKMFRDLDSKAKARLHNRKSEIAQQRLLDYSEEMSELPLTGKDVFKYYVNQAKNMYEIAKETALALYYSIRV